MGDKPEQYEIADAILVLVKLLDDYHIEGLINHLYNFRDNREDK